MASISLYNADVTALLAREHERHTQAAQRSFEIDPLACPKCGGAMKIKAFLTNQNEIARLSKNLGIPMQRAPPQLRYSLPLAA